MKDPTQGLQLWVTVGGCVLVVATLYWAQAILAPIAIALLLTFLLTPLVTAVQRVVGRIAAVIVVALLVFAILTGLAWAFTQQLASLAGELPSYRQNIRQKIADVRGLGKGSAVEKLQTTVEDIQNEIGNGNGRRGTAERSLIAEYRQATGIWGFPHWLGTILEPMASAGLVAALVIFMLLDREDLRGRLIGLIGHGHLTVTTRAFEEAASRVSRYLLMQSIVNLIYGVGVGIGLYAIGVPYALLWAALAAAFRFIPYVGPLIAIAAPLLVSLAALPGWIGTLWLVGLFTVELFTNLVLETVLYAEAAGISQVALLIAIAFWTWLWGPLGLLLATPLTVCLVVVGKHVPGLEFLSTLMADAPALASDLALYQRLLARDQDEAAELIERYTRTEPAESVYDAMLVPALTYVERDRLEGRLSIEEEDEVVEGARELMNDTVALGATTGSAWDGPAEAQHAAANHPIVYGYPAHSRADELALRMLGELLRETPVAIDIASKRIMISEMIATIRERGFPIVCIADLPPSSPSKTSYLVKKLRQALPELKIVVGRWAPPALADDSAQPLVVAGANAVASTLIETREQLHQIALHLPRSVTPTVETSVA